MTVEEFIRAAADATFIAIFVVVLIRNVRAPRESMTDAVLFFGALASLVVTGAIARMLGIDGLPAPLQLVRGAVALALPYLLLRLVDDFAPVPSLVHLAAVGGLAVAAASLFFLPRPYSSLHVIAMVGYFVILQGYDTLRFALAVNAHTGATRARMRAATVGSAFLALALVSAAATVLRPTSPVPLDGLTSAFGLGCAIGYFLAFAPTRSIRQYWEGPQLRSFLSSMVRLPAQASMEEIERVTEAATAEALGAPHAVMMLWDEEGQRLIVPRIAMDAEWEFVEPETTVMTRAYRARRPRATLNAGADDPANADTYHRFGASAILAAPISVDSAQLCYGVLAVFSDRASVFTEGDLPLLTLLARELGGFLQRRDFVVHATNLEARETATRLKDEFLSTAAHDLRTPLTVVVAQGQLLRRHLRTRPDAVDANVAEADRLVREAERMWRMTNDLLDASRLDARGFIAERHPIDLVELVHDVAATVDSPRHDVRVLGDPVVAPVDSERMRQVVQNLVDNAVKFSPNGGEIIVGLRYVDNEAEIRVSDHGIGIPASELTQVFERFHRAVDVEGRGFGGVGVGLFLCKRIVEEHGGRIWAESQHGHGSEFFVRLPATLSDDSEDVG